MQAIAVIDAAGGIGAQGQLLCHLPGDLAHFKETTLGKVVIMGRKTLESLPGGRPLAQRTTLVLSSRDLPSCPLAEGQGSCRRFPSAQALLSYLEGGVPSEDLFVAGGEQIYRLLLPHCQGLILTELETVFPQADTFFPEFKEDFERCRQGDLQEERGLRYRINHYQRKEKRHEGETCV